MKPLYWLLSAALLMACSLQVVASPPPPTPSPSPQPTRTLVPVPIEPSAAATVTATLQAIALAGPRMEVGSMWPYVDGSILVAVPGGPFTMGHGGTDNPEHTVTLSDFWVYQAKVTNQEYALCVKAGKCKVPDPVDDFTFTDLPHANDPVVGVTYAQGSDYCAFVHGRLPTEAEWEKTARGPDGNLYPWGSNSPVCDFLNFNNCVGRITNVTTYEKGQSFYHALDMEGNVFEWVADWYSALYYSTSAGKDPRGPDVGQVRSVRSSSYKSNPDQVPASTRFFTQPKDHRRDLGFRCVVDDPTYFAPLCTTFSLIGNPPPGGPSSGPVTPDCPSVGIGLTEVCQQGKVTVVVVDSRSPDSSASISGIASCNPVSVTPDTFPQIYDCTSDTTVTVTSACSYPASATPTCADHFNLNPSTGLCDWDGSLTSGSACLPGLTYDPVKQCCTSQSDPATDYPICQLGSALGYVSGHPVCLANGQLVNNPSATEYVHIKDKSACTGGGAGPCTLTPVSCRQQCKYGGVFVPSTCSCVCYPG